MNKYEFLRCYLSNISNNLSTEICLSNQEEEEDLGPVRDLRRSDLVAESGHLWKRKIILGTSFRGEPQNLFGTMVATAWYFEVISTSEID